MTFKHLENTLADEQVAHYLEFCNELQEPTRTVLGYTLDIASHLDSHGLSEQYAVFGGYAVLSHLMSTFGDPVARAWRGSTDIDMGGNHKVLSSIKSGYHMSNDSPSPNIPDKRTLKLDIDGEGECKIDFYLGDITKKYGDSRINTHFGIPLRAVNPEHIIRGKLRTPIEELYHYGDIMGMLAVLEREQYSPKELAEILNHDEAVELQERIVVGERQFSRDRFGFFPSKEFSDDVKKQLHKRRPVR